MVNHITQPINWGDLLRDTMHLDPTAFGSYMRLIGHYWAHEGLPADERLLQRITGLSWKQWHRYRPVLQSFFHDGWKHKRCDEDLAKRREFRDKQRGNASKRWESNSDAKPLKSNGAGDATASVWHSGDNSLDRTPIRKEYANSPNSLKSIEAGDATALPTLPLKKDISNLSSEDKSRAREALKQSGTAWAHVDSPQYRAWQKYREALGLGTPLDNRFGWNFPAEWPPNGEAP